MGIGQQLIIQEREGGNPMFRNKYFRNNQPANKKYVSILNKLSANRDTILQLQQQMDEIQAKLDHDKEEAKFDSHSESTAPKSEIGQEDWKDEASVHHLPFQDFLHSTIGCSHFTPKLNLEFLNVEEQSAFLLKGYNLLTAILDQEKHSIEEVMEQRMEQRVKFFLIYQKICENLQKAIADDAKLWQTCQQLLFELFRSEIYSITKQMITNMQIVSKRHLLFQKQEEEKERQRARTASSQGLYELD